MTIYLFIFIKLLYQTCYFTILVLYYIDISTVFAAEYKQKIVFQYYLAKKELPEKKHFIMTVMSGIQLLRYYA